MRAVLFAAAVWAAAPAAHAEPSVAPREGWAVIGTQKTYETLLSDLKAAVKANGMFVVTEAGPTGAAKQRGIEIPGNRVVGVYRNDYAVRALEASTAAMIEAPIRFYVTEDAEGTATLSYKTPSFVLAPYAEDGGAALADVATELDEIFAAIARDAAQ